MYTDKTDGALCLLSYKKFEAQLKEVFKKRHLSHDQVEALMDLCHSAFSAGWVSYQADGKQE
ncbi:hypothetical protein D3C78_1463260 [compost metagenome]